jgi:hypothetical protein
VEKVLYIDELMLVNIVNNLSYLCFIGDMINSLTTASRI